MDIVETGFEAGGGLVARETPEQVFEFLRQAIAEVIGEEAASLVEIRYGSQFIKDLEMDSIQIVAFGEKVNDRYGATVDFVGWLSNKPIRKLLKLTVGDVAEFIARGA